MCGLSTVVTPAGASLTMYREIRPYANSIWDDNNTTTHNYWRPVARLRGLLTTIYQYAEYCCGWILAKRWMCVVCVFFPFILDVRFVDVPAGVTQEECKDSSSTLLLRCLPLIFLVRGSQPFLFLVDREVEFCVLTIYSPFSDCWAFFFFLTGCPGSSEVTS